MIVGTDLVLAPRADLVLVEPPAVAVRRPVPWVLIVIGVPCWLAVLGALIYVLTTSAG